MSSAWRVLLDQRFFRFDVKPIAIEQRLIQREVNLESLPHLGTETQRGQDPCSSSHSNLRQSQDENQV